MENEVTGGPVEVNDAAAGNSEPTENTGGEQTSETSGDSVNPAWSSLLEKLPSSLVPLVTPELKSWDEKFQQQLQQVHSQYDPYKPFIEQQVDPEALQQAYDVYRLMNENPQFLYEQMGQYYGFSGQGQQEAGNNPQGENPEESTFDWNDPEVDITQHPKFQELFENQQVLAQFLVQQQEQEKLAQAEQQVEEELATVKEKYPQLDELLIFQTATGGRMSLTQAAELLNHQYESMLAQSRQPAPRVFSANGGLPAQQVPDPAKLDSKATKSLVADILARAHDEG